MGIRTQFPLGFSIINLVMSHRNLTTERVRQLGLYPGQDVVLLELLDHDGQLQNALVTALGLDHSTVTKSVARLKKNDIVTTEKSQTDRRATIVTLTPKGRRLAQEVAKIWDSVEATVLQDLTPAERDQFLTMTHQITTRFNQTAAAERQTKQDKKA